MLATILTPIMPQKKTDYLLFCLLATFWGGSFVAVKFVVRDFPPVFGAALRVATALLTLSAIFKYERHSLRAPFNLRWRMWVAGLFAQGLPFSLLFWGERLISPGLAGIINGTVPIWTFLLGLFPAGMESLSARKFFGLFLGLAGVAVIFRPLIFFGGTRGELLGTLAVFLMAVSYAVGSLMSRALLSGRARADFRANLFHQHCGSLVFLVVVSTAAESWPEPRLMFESKAALAAIVYLGLFSTALAWFIYYHLIREWGAVRATTVTYVAPVIALFWDFVFFDNVPRLSESFGVLAILSGVILLHSSGGVRAAG